MLQAAVNCDEENAELYRDLAITEASLGDYEQAENYLREAKKRNLKEEDVSLIRAEIDLLQGDVQTAYFMAEKVLENTSDDLMFHAVHVFYRRHRNPDIWKKGISFCAKSRKHAGQQSGFLAEKCGEDGFADE